ncbi:PH domain leucine-rich repeat-containing protein phosphatase 1-like [Acipenser ruthenus]|uniref:PH domain leucine-rich repeat-containing protein phosphatase 1-like n=1 Tax=Acipenser ruthenus TaxID=7906 RepID=UPI0027420FBA|nr:PH domain leucine-rich repeat-containing protein phosphatase 1-like [Acipenser ruthenus]
MPKMQSARALMVEARQVDDSYSPAIGAAVSDSEIGNISSKLKGSSSSTVVTVNGAVKADYDAGGGGSKAESRELRVASAPLLNISIGNGTQLVPAACARTTAGSLTSNSLLLRRRRLKRNLSAAAATSTPSVAAASADASSTSTPALSSNLNTRSLDRKMLLRHRQMMQLQSSDKEWVRADLQRGCLHVHDRLMPSYLRPVLCTLESTAGEVGGRLSQQASKGGKVVKVIGKGTNVADTTGRLKNGVAFSRVDNANARAKAFDVVNGNAKSGHLNSFKNGNYINGQSTTLNGRLRLPLENTSHRQQLDTDFLRLGPLAEDKTLTSPSDMHVNANFGLILDGPDTSLLHNKVDNSGLKNLAGDFECSTYDEVSGAVSINGHPDSMTDGMVFDTDSFSLSPTVDSAPEGLDAFGSSSDELELDCASSSVVINSIARRLPSPDITNVNRPCDNESPNDEANNNRGVRYETPNSSRLQSCNSVARPCQTGNFSTSQVCRYPGTLTVAPASEHYSIPTLYVQLHGEAARRLEPDEKPLQIQNDYLFQLGFKDPWRVQEEGMDSEIGCLIRFYAGKPHSIESSERIQLSGTFNVRKGKMQLPVNRWTKRQVILCGTCLIVSSVKDSQSGKMHILPLIGGKVEEVKKHQHCLAFSSTGPQSHTYYICFDTFTEYLRWLRQASKIVSQRISSVDLSCCSLEHLPANLFYSQDLTHLNLKQNFLRHTLGPVASRSLTELQRFSKLRSLNLSNNHLGDFPLAICDIPTLTEVNLSCNCLSTVHAAVGNMHNLQTFLLDGNYLQSLPMELEKLQNLSYLGLSFNEFTEIPVVLQMLAAMEKLCMSGNNLHTLNLQTLRLLHVKHVDLRLNKIRRVVQEEPDFLRHITHLDLRDNHLCHLDCTAFTKLEVLHCERNHLAALKVSGCLLKGLYVSSNELSQLEVYPVPSYLAYMDVSRNRLESLPEWVCESKKLEVLDIGHNQICELPVRLFCNSSLRKLLAGHNQLRKLPERLERTEVEVLDVQHNQLLELPSNLFLKADSLRCLNASANKLETLPPSSVSEESHSILQELYLTNNRLTDKCVPLLTGHCHLRVLHLAYNHMQSFPASKMAKLEELEEVDFSGNKLKAIPTTIMNCRRMHTVIAHSNCIDVFPEVMQLMEIKCVDLSCNELNEITLPENLPPKLQELDLTGNPRLALDHKTLELLNNIRCFKIDQSPTSFSASDAPGAPAVWSHGYTEASGVKNKLCVAALSANNLCDNREALYGVFDGDRNVEVPCLLQCTMSDVLAEELHKSKSEEEYMTSTFLVMQRKLGTAGQKLGGSAVLCHIKHDPMNPGGCFTLTAANVGKCQAILCRDGKPLPLSTVHTVSCEEELQRIKQHKAIVTEDNKVNGVTDSTRILGYSFLHPSVVPRPHIQSVTLTPQDEFFILGSRGLWDSVSPSEAVEAVRNVPDALAAAKKLCTLAQSYGCNDSVSAVVVQLSVTEDCFCCCELNGVPPPSPGIFPPSVVIKYRPTQADTLGMPSSSSGMASEISSEISTSEMSSEVGSTASDEPPQGAIINDHSGSVCASEQRCCTLHPVCLSGSFQRQLSSATFSSALSDNGLDSDDEEPIAGVFSNGSRVEVEVDIHYLRAKEKGLISHPPPPEACDEGIVISANEEETTGMVPDRTLLIKLQGDRGWAGSLRRRGDDCCMGRRRGNGSVAPSQKSHNLIEVATDAPTKKTGGYFAAPAQPDPDDQFIIPPELEEEVKEIMKQHQEQQQRQCQADQMPDYYDTPL